MHRLSLPCAAAVVALLLIGRALAAPAPNLPSATGHLPPATGHLPPATRHLPPATGHLPPATRHSSLTITQTLTLTPTQDNTLYESELGTISNGAGQYLFAGTTNNSDARRAVLAFDLDGLPPGATVLSATLALTMSRTIAGDSAVTLHALSAGWGEGTSDAIGEEGAGATATPGDATWRYTFFDSAEWAAPGGDFAAAPSATTTVGGIGVYTWAAPALAVDIAGWLAAPATNHGWLLLGDESAAGTAKRFDSRESAPANRPRLTVTYTAAVETAFVPAIYGE